MSGFNRTRVKKLPLETKNRQNNKIRGCVLFNRFIYSDGNVVIAKLYKPLSTGLSGICIATDKALFSFEKC